MSKLLSDEELRKSLKDFLKGGLLNDGTLNPNTLNTLERFINTQKRLYAESVIGEDYPKVTQRYSGGIWLGEKQLDFTDVEEARTHYKTRNIEKSEQRARIK